MGNCHSYKIYDVDQLRPNKKEKVDVFDTLQIPNKEVKYITECWLIESMLSLLNLSIFKNIYIVDKFLIIGYKRKKCKIKQKIEYSEVIKQLLNITELDLIEKIKKDNLKKKKDKMIITMEEKMMEEGKLKENWKYHSNLLRLLKDNNYYFTVYHPLNDRIKNKIDTESVNCIEKCFNLWQYHSGDMSMEYLSWKFESMKEITKLCLVSNDITDKGLEYLSYSFKYIPSLKQILLNSNNITSNGIKHLSINLKYLYNLSVFDIVYNSIGDLGLKYICSHFSDIMDLAYLGIGCNRITDKGVNYMCSNLNYISQLYGLNLTYNCITDSVTQNLITSLSFCPNLQKLYIYENDLTNYDAFKNDLLNSHPNKSIDVYVYNNGVFYM